MKRFFVGRSATFGPVIYVVTEGRYFQSRSVAGTLVPPILEHWFRLRNHDMEALENTTSYFEVTEDNLHVLDQQLALHQCRSDLLQLPAIAAIAMVPPRVGFPTPYIPEPPPPPPKTNHKIGVPKNKLP